MAPECTVKIGHCVVSPPGVHVGTDMDVHTPKRRAQSVGAELMSSLVWHAECRFPPMTQIRPHVDHW